MKTTFDLPKDLIREMKLRAVAQRRTLNDLVADYLRQGLFMAPHALAQPVANSRVRIDANGLPVIQCRANAPVSRMSRKKLLRFQQSALAEEDAKRSGIAV